MAVVKIKVFVSEIDNVITLFDRIQVQRSEAGSPFTDADALTADSATKAAITGTEEGSFSGLQGKTLKLKVNDGAEQVVTFVTPDPISIGNVVSEVGAALTGLTPSSDGGKLKLECDTTGTAGTLEITGGTGLTELGLVLGTKAHGLDLHPQLLAGISEYEYDDQSGAASYYYRTRYYNQTLGTYSSWSDWIQGTTGSIIDSAYLIVGKIKLADLDGTALVGAHVTVVNVYNPLIADTYFIAGANKRLETDGSGQAETTLIKGSTIDLVVEGTSIIRRILVPSTGTEFDLMDPALVQDDPFQIQVPDLPAAVRRS